MGVTIRDVARRAGVSISTVSRVLNDSSPVSPDKQRRVVEAVEALGYTPNPAARSLLKRETGGLGVLLPAIGGEFFSMLIDSIDRATQQHGFFLMVSSSHWSEKAFRAALKGTYRRVDGMLIMAPEMAAEAVQDLMTPDVPVVFINTQVQGTAFDAINFDNYGGAYVLARHLIRQGHRRIALIKGPPLAFDARERRRGYRAALRDAGITPDEHLEVQGDYTHEAGLEAARRVLALDPLPTAIMAANDVSAHAMVHALHEAGWGVPDDFSITGFDDILSSKYTTPPLTTVNVPIAQMGTSAILRLIDRIRGETPWMPEERVLPVRLIVRESTKRMAVSESTV